MTEQNEHQVTLGEAVAHLAVSLISWGVSIGVSYMVIRIVSQPDFGRTMVMKVAKDGERYCMRQAQLWASRADRFSHTYDTARQIVS